VESFDIVWIPWWIRVADVITRCESQLHRAMRHTLQRLKLAAKAMATAAR